MKPSALCWSPGDSRFVDPGVGYIFNWDKSSIKLPSQAGWSGALPQDHLMVCAQPRFFNASLSDGWSKRYRSPSLGRTAVHFFDRGGCHPPVLFCLEGKDANRLGPESFALFEPLGGNALGVGWNRGCLEMRLGFSRIRMTRLIVGLFGDYWRRVKWCSAWPVLSLASLFDSGLGFGLHQTRFASIGLL